MLQSQGFGDGHSFYLEINILFEKRIIITRFSRSCAANSCCGLFFQEK